jgi:hypothetical protein
MRNVQLPYQKGGICLLPLKKEKSVPILHVHAKPCRVKSSVLKIVPLPSLQANANADILTADTLKA